MIHSDQGSHYTSPQFSNLLDEYQIIKSISRHEKWTDNALIESFFGTSNEGLYMWTAIT